VGHSKTQRTIELRLKPKHTKIMTNELYKKIINRQWDQIEDEELIGICKDFLEEFSYEELNWLMHYLVFERPSDEHSDPKLIQLVDLLEEHLGTQHTGMIIIS
jgi:hypothetical protein